MRAILRSPMHPVLSGRLVLLTVTGRRTGRRFTFPTGYEQKGNRVRVTVGWPERKRWWRNLREAAPVELVVRGVRRTGLARAHGDERSGVTVDIELDPAPERRLRTEGDR